MKIQLSNITCGHSCWFAKEQDCKCSCGGKNHGILLKEGSEQPQRTKKEAGKLYYLEAVGSRIELMEQVNRLLPAFTGDPRANAGWFDFNPSKTGNPFRVQYASKSQVRKWKELSQFADVSDEDFYFVSPALLWRREDVPAELFEPKSLKDIIIEAVEKVEGAKIYRHYSGRRMNGAECLGITINKDFVPAGTLMLIGVEIQKTDPEQAIRFIELTQTAREDSLGHDTLFYFPEIVDNWKEQNNG